MYYGAGGHLRAESPPRRSGQGIRIQRRSSNADAPESIPPVKPPSVCGDQSRFQSLNRSNRGDDEQNQSTSTSGTQEVLRSKPLETQTHKIDFSLNDSQEHMNPPPQIPSRQEFRVRSHPMTSHSTSSGNERVAASNASRSDYGSRRELQLESRADTGNEEVHETRASYVEEPPSHENTLRRGKSSNALVRRVTNEMALAHYVHKVEINQEGGPGHSSGVYRCNRWPELGMRRLFWHLGKAVANHNTLFTFIPLFFVSLCVVGPILYRDQLHLTLPFHTLIPLTNVDVTSSGVGIRRPVVPQFNQTNPTYAAMDRMNHHNYAVLMRTSDPKDTVLQQTAITAYRDLKAMVQAIELEGKTWKEICGANCDTNSAIIDKIIKKSDQIALMYPETYVALSQDAGNLSRIYLANTIGGVELDVDGAVASARSFLATFQLNKGLSREETNEWEHGFVDKVSLASSSSVDSPLQYFRWSFADFADTVLEALRRCHVLLGISAIVLCCICFISSLAGNAYQSKPLVGIATTVVLLLSAFAALCVSVAGSGTLNPLLFPVLFIVVGIGIAGCSSLHGAWSKFSAVALHPTEKIAVIMAYEGTFVCATCLLLISMFVTAGLITTTPFMQNAFLTAAAGIAALLILTVMYLTVFVFKSGQRESKGCKWYHFCRSGDTHFPAPNLSDFDNTSLEALHDRLIDSKPTPSRQLAAWLLKPSLRYPLVFICTLYLIFAIWGCLHIKIDLREEHFLPSESHARKFLENFREMFGRTEEYLEITIEQSLDYHDVDVRQSIIDLVDKPVKEQYASRSVNWLSDFSRFEKNSIYDINQDTFVPVVRLVFLATDPYQRFSTDITFDRFETQITRSRMYLELTPKGGANRKALIDELLEKARASQLPVTVKAPFVFSTHHDLQALSSAMLSFGVFLAVLLLVTLVIFGQPALTLVVVATSFCVLAETIGYASHWGVPLNTVTFTMAICANSVSCVVALAFCYTYANSGKGLRPTQRVQYTFQSCLLSLILACSLPVLTYIPLLSIDAPIIMHIWRILLLNAVASFIHFLLFLPNMLTFLNEHAWTAISNICTGGDDDSVYYIPTTGRIAPAEGLYASYTTYSVPKIAPPPSYLAIGPADPLYGRYEGHYAARTRQPSAAESSAVGTPICGRDRQPRRHSNKESHEGIYEAPPSPRVRSSHSPVNSQVGGNRTRMEPSMRREHRHQESARQQERAELHNQNWRHLLSEPQQPQSYFPQAYGNPAFYPR